MWHSLQSVLASFTIGLLLLNSQTNCLDWKFAVRTPTDIRLFYSNWTYANHRIYNNVGMKNVGLVAYDKLCNTLYYVNNNFTKNQGEIYKLTNFDVENSAPQHNRIIGEQNIIKGIVFDSVQGDLYWSDRSKIIKYNEASNTYTTILQSDTKFPTDIALGCGRELYYINQHAMNSSIEEINLHTTESRVVVSNLTTVRSITADCDSQKLYWFDNLRSTNIRISQANFDGTEQSLVFERSAANPFHLISDSDYIYYSSMTYRKVIQIHKQNGTRTIIDYDFRRTTPVDILIKPIISQTKKETNKRTCG